ncbi:MAG: TPM domain-containing protein [Verrucomicrobia bacterium]|nr:TPM domain-containing protein [Verrucomicrobiota bacterium]MBI3870903.1 TPM domain-containing protein [Verrucomicrobiota bacterium]
MKNAHRGLLMIGVLAACWLGGGAALAVGPEVRDSAGLFSPSAVKQADDAVRRIQRDLRKDLVVETFAGVPENRKEDYARNREEFFSGFVRDRAQSARIDGIYVLVMKEPPPHRYRIQVGIGQATRQRAFLTSDRDELVRVIQTSFREDKFDEGLRSGVAFVERTLRGNLQGGSTLRSPASAAPMRQDAPGGSSSFGSSIGSYIVIGVFVLGGIMLVGFVVRLLRGGMGGGAPGMGGMGGGYGYGGGGGFFSSLLGGIGGAIAGSWLYDRFLGGDARASDGFGSTHSDSQPSDVGGDWTSSGGDVDSGGGGDFGGGGGDSGGGGDGGGGGGDA